MAIRAVLRRKGGIRRHRRYANRIEYAFRHAVVMMVPYDPNDPKFEWPDQTGWWQEYLR